jgi:hypothetical protein
MRRNLATNEATETLPDRQLRAIRPGDRERLHEEFLKLSNAIVGDRSSSTRLDPTPAESSYFTEVDIADHVALVAELETSATRRPVAVGRLLRKPGQPYHSKVALTVTDARHGKGIPARLTRAVEPVAPS